MANDDIRERLAVLEQKEDNNNGRIKNHAIRIEKLEGNSDVLVRLATLMEVQTEMDAKQNKQLEKFGETLDNVNSNLSMLNLSHEQLKTDMDSIGSKVKHIEKSQAEEAEKTKVDMKVIWTEVVKKLFYLIPSIVLAAVLIWLGLK
ncbi:hypothetical protein ABE073_03760 [Lederbergia citrisecunda]|uniref:hypothetical protein n=1 Tax=Lederbergia citrisecunda TaxID=2833583 RepID=UPI003D2D65AA